MSRLSNPPMIYTAHGIVAKEEGIGKKHTYAIFQEEHCKKAKKITCPSENTKNNLSYYYPEFSKKIEVIYNGTDFTKYANDETVERWSRKLREEYAPNGERIITYVGRLVPEKGVLDLAKAFRMIMDDHDAVLVYCGPYETYQYFANQISYEILPDMKDYVIFTENVNDRKELAAVYKASDAVVIPSYSETFSLAAIEAMAMGSPVVISDVDAPRELFVNNGMAIGVQPGNIESIRQGIDYVLSNREESMIRSSLDQQKIVEKYSIEAVSNRWMNTYLSVAAASC
jgi:glycogen(starch) synthase